jgi:hypothetical protein
MNPAFQTKWSWIIINISSLLFLYFFLKYFFKYLASKKIRSRYKFALFSFGISILQIIMCFFLGVLPGLILLYAYLLSAFNVFIWVILKMSGYDISNLSYSILVLSQIPFYSLVGFLLGILYEWYGTGGDKL